MVGFDEAVNIMAAHNKIFDVPKLVGYEVIETCRDVDILIKDNIISIQGSYTLWDWIINLDFLFSEVGSGHRMHTGFKRGALEALGAVKNKLNLNEEICLVGYSNGAGVAQSLAYFLEKLGATSIKLFLFAAPYALDVEAAASMTKSRAVYVINYRDIVTWLNCCFPKRNATRIEGDYVYLKPTKTIPWLGYLDAFIRLDRWNFILSHLPSSYIKNIKENQKY